MPRVHAGRSNGLLCVSAAAPPAFRIPSAMEYGVDNDLCPFDLEEDAVWEAAQQGPTHWRIDELIGLGMASNR
jgi:hypothetical protein